MIPLVLLPGMMCTAQLFSHQIAYFSKERVVHFSPLVAHEDIALLAEEVLQQAPSTFALCGLSMGGIVAMEVIRQAPARVRGLALLDTNPLAELEEVKQRRLPQIDKVRAGGLLDVVRDEMKPNYLADGAGKANILDLCLQMAMTLGPDVFIRQSIALRDRPDQSNTLRSVKVPTLVLCGEDDRLCSIETHQLISELVFGATLSVVEGAGHLPVLEQTEVVNNLLGKWLLRCELNL